MNTSVSTRNIKPSRVTQSQRRVLIAALFIVFFGGCITWWVLSLASVQRINTAGYQIIQLTTGQAYFGKLQNTSGEYLKILSPYTAQAVTPPVDTNETNESPASNDLNQQTTLVKLSDQVYGPEDVISIKSDQVLFWQNLSTSSKITEAIVNRKEGK